MPHINKMTVILRIKISKIKAINSKKTQYWEERLKKLSLPNWLPRFSNFDLTALQATLYAVSSY